MRDVDQTTVFSSLYASHATFVEIISEIHFLIPLFRRENCFGRFEDQSTGQTCFTLPTQYDPKPRLCNTTNCVEGIKSIQLFVFEKSLIMIKS